MALLTKSPKGTQDILPDEIEKWQYIETVLLDTAKYFGFTEIRTPVFEHTELFERSVGETTDVVQKEMYTFEKAERSLTLKPEGTAGVARAVVQSGIINEALPVKVAYITPCFRYENTQKGRLREFHQFGVEAFGADSPSVDAEIISLAESAFTSLGVVDLKLEINSIGCPKCRPNYHKALKQYFSANAAELCPTCLERLDKNPMRILDCKNHECAEIAANAPVTLDYLCDECSQHFEGLKNRLDMMNIAYSINPKIVRGLDYYTKTVFEFITDKIGAQATVCGGGRYDGLLEELGGPKASGIGFALGIERLILLMEACECKYPEKTRCDIYIGSMGEQAAVKALQICYYLRNAGHIAECDLMNRSVKAQMKYADKIKARYSMIIGSNELETGKANLKNMSTGQTVAVDFEDISQFSDELCELLDKEAYESLLNSIEDLKF
ncbi:MAG TPA: histidine--tRNA ligase [Ruminococcaceae bacterium]|nr:histidine--tRNA ligase [Oscillospiraceae bacterium]